MLFAAAFVAALCTLPSTGSVHAASHKVSFYDGPGAAYIVRLTGSARCTGAIFESNKVITAAHCVFENGKLKTGVTVEYRGVTYQPAFVIANPNRPAGHIIPEGDVAILTFTTKFPGPSVRVGGDLPRRGSLIAVGYQSIDSNGRLVRPKSYNDKSHLKPGLNVFTMRMSACTLDASSLRRYPAHFNGVCGLIPGGSGGPVLELRRDGAIMHGVLSTVNDALTVNTWAGGSAIKHVVERRDGVKVLSLNGPIVGAPPFRS